MEREHIQSTDLEEIKAAPWEQASHPCTQVRWGVAQVMAARKNRGQLLVLLRGGGRWYPAEAVTIERPRQCPTGACDLGEETADQETKRAEPFNDTRLEVLIHRPEQEH
jgi:hypothetical protein